MANPDGNEMVTIKMMWYTFSIQRGPVEKMKEMTCEKGRRHGERKEREPPAYLCLEMDQPTSMNLKSLKKTV
jgi:hypothetical protein